MTRRLLAAAVALLTAVSLASAPAVAADGARGSRHAMPADYAWLGERKPDIDYQIVVVRGLSAAEVIRVLGTVSERLDDLSPRQAERWTSRHTSNDYSAPRMAQVARRGRAVVVYLPYWFVGRDVVAELSRRGTAVEFGTTVELDTYLTVARRGRVIRTFDAFFRPPRRGALPEERGLDWGTPHQNVWATAWAFTERLTLTHLSEEWFGSEHPSYVFEGSAP